MGGRFLKTGGVVMQERSVNQDEREHSKRKGCRRPQRGGAADWWHVIGLYDRSLHASAILPS